MFLDAALFTRQHKMPFKCERRFSKWLFITQVRETSSKEANQTSRPLQAREIELFVFLFFGGLNLDEARVKTNTSPTVNNKCFGSSLIILPLRKHRVESLVDLNIHSLIQTNKLKLLFFSSCAIIPQIYRLININESLQIHSNSLENQKESWRFLQETAKICHVAVFARSEASVVIWN